MPERVITKSGRALSDADIERLADRLDEGIDLSTWRPRRGRPSLGVNSHEHSPRIAVRIPDALNDRVRMRAAREGRSVSDVVRALLEGYAPTASLPLTRQRPIGSNVIDREIVARTRTGEETMRTQAEQIAALRSDQAFWRALAAEVGPARYAEPGPMGEWSFADMAGHLSGWRERTINRVLAIGRGEPEPAPPWPADLDADDDVDKVNDWIRDQHAGSSPEQLVAEYDASYDRLIEALELIPPNRQTAVAEWAGEPLVEVDFTGHLHEEHVEPVRAWLDRG